jgi:hypothetical protein
MSQTVRRCTRALATGEETGTLTLPLATVDLQGAVTVGGTPAGNSMLPVDQHLTIPAPTPPPLITATPAPEPTTTTTAPPASPPLPAGGFGTLLGSLLGGG